MDKIFVPIKNTRRPYKLFIKRNNKRVINPRVVARLNKNFMDVALPSKYAWDKKNRKVVNLFSGNSNNTSVEFKKLNKTERKQLQYYGNTLYDRKNNKLINSKKVLNKQGGLRKEYVDNKILKSNQITEYKQKIINKIMSFNHTYQIKFKDYITKKDGVKKTGRTEPRTKSFTFNYTNKWTQKQIDDKKASMIKAEGERLAEESPAFDLDFLDDDEDEATSVSVNVGVDNYEFDLNYSKPLIIDGMEQQEWNTNTNKCVYDYIQYRYGNLTGCKKITDYKTLYYIFNNPELEPLSIRADNKQDVESFFNTHYLNEKQFLERLEKTKDPYANFLVRDINGGIWGAGELLEMVGEDEEHRIYTTYNNFLKVFWGVNPKQIQNFCKYMKIPHYCLDNQDKVIHYYYPKDKNQNNKIPAMCYKVSGGHIHPITDSAKVRSLAQMLSEYTKAKEVKKEETEEKKKEPIQVKEVINCKDRIAYLINVMKETNTQVISKKVKMYGDDLQAFTIDKTKYVFIETDEQEPINYGKLYCKLNNIEYVGQSLPQLAGELLKEHLTIKSEPNHIVNKILHTDKIKYRTQLGFTRNHTEFDITPDCKAYDIAKCYSKCITEPTQEFITFDYNAIPQKYQGEDITAGLYYIDTDDHELYHGTNIYSSAIVNVGLLNNIITKKNILWYIPASKTHSKELFKPLFEEFKNNSKGDVNLNKLLNNLTTGLVGKSKNKKTQFSCSTELNDAFNYLQEYKDYNCYLRQHNGVCVYGNKVVRELEQHNIPIYIQLLDESNIRLYQLAKDATNNKLHNVLYRKTDCVVVREPNTNIKLGEEWGEYRQEHLPNIYLNVDITERTPKIEQPQFSGDFIYQYVDINDSSDFKQIHQVLRCNGGLMVNGSAGTGKSYVIKKISEEVGNDQVARLCFTNKGALNIEGQTIHKFLGLNKEGKILQSNIEKIQKQIKLIIIDEVSMVSAYLWARLYTLYKQTNIPFLLVGDWKQIPPVEDLKPFNYLYHPAVVDLSKGKIIELTQVYRYDMELKHASNNVMELDTKQFGNKVTKSNICYYNHTRKRVNAMVVNMMIKSKGITNTIEVEQLKYKQGAKETKEEYEARSKKNPTQTIKLFEGMPVIASSTIEQGAVCVNNEEFILTKVGADKITATSQRPDGTHIVEIETKDFYKHFLVAYCITTHKAQGSTIQGKMTIWDWDNMDEALRYTALTRATKKEYINFTN